MTQPLLDVAGVQKTYTGSGRTVEVEGPAIERWTTQKADEHGFTDVQHHLEIFGTCAACASTPAAQS